ncbi:MAG: hypothetical protein K0R82_669 [Flavipsychrobacter sp.]|jgi:hypothetical protein|nr:hypothetical protein [Flavipsychrobacter sp.]
MFRNFFEGKFSGMQGVSCTTVGKGWSPVVQLLKKLS